MNLVLSSLEGIGSLTTAYPFTFMIFVVAEAPTKLGRDGKSYGLAVDILSAKDRRSSTILGEFGTEVSDWSTGTIGGTII